MQVPLINKLNTWFTPAFLAPELQAQALAVACADSFAAGLTSISTSSNTSTLAHTWGLTVATTTAHSHDQHGIDNQSYTLNDLATAACACHHALTAVAQFFTYRNVLTGNLSGAHADILSHTTRARTYASFGSYFSARLSSSLRSCSSFICSLFGSSSFRTHLLTGTVTSACAKAPIDDHTRTSVAPCADYDFTDAYTSDDIFDSISGRIITGHTVLTTLTKLTYKLLRTCLTPLTTLDSSTSCALATTVMSVSPAALCAATSDLISTISFNDSESISSTTLASVSDSDLTPYSSAKINLNTQTTLELSTSSAPNAACYISSTCQASHVSSTPMLSDGSEVTPEIKALAKITPKATDFETHPLSSNLLVLPDGEMADKASLTNLAAPTGSIAPAVHAVTDHAACAVFTAGVTSWTQAIKPALCAALDLAAHVDKFMALCRLHLNGVRQFMSLHTLYFKDNNTLESSLKTTLSARTLLSTSLSLCHSTHSTSYYDLNDPGVGRIKHGLLTNSHALSFHCWTKMKPAQAPSANAQGASILSQDKTMSIFLKQAAGKIDEAGKLDKRDPINQEPLSIPNCSGTTDSTQLTKNLTTGLPLMRFMRRGSGHDLSQVSAALRGLTLVCCGVLGASLLTGCSIAENEEAAQKVISASADSVKGCTFLGDVDSIARATLPNARYELKLAASKLGATHVVETAAYAQPYNNLEWDLGIALSGRAYKCPVGQGPVENNPQSYKELPYDMPHPEVNRDDPLMMGPLRPTYIGKPHNL